MAELVSVDGNLNEECIDWLSYEVQNRIRAVLPPNAELGADKSLWPGNGKGEFTIASAYHLLSTDFDYGEQQNQIWKLYIHELDVSFG